MIVGLVDSLQIRFLKGLQRYDAALLLGNQGAVLKQASGSGPTPGPAGPSFQAPRPVSVAGCSPRSGRTGAHTAQPSPLTGAQGGSALSPPDCQWLQKMLLRLI